MAEAPDEFLDPILSTLMLDPVTLPDSRVTWIGLPSSGISGPVQPTPLGEGLIPPLPPLGDVQCRVTTRQQAWQPAC